MVIRRSLWLGLVVLVLMGTGAGCRRSETEPPKQVKNDPERSRVLARIHWVGRDQLFADTNAAYLTNLVHVPEAPKVGEEILQKLSRAPWSSFVGLTNAPSASNDSSGLLLALLRTVVANESCLEVQALSNRPLNLVFAIKLNTNDAPLWTSNSPAILDSFAKLTRTEAGPKGKAWFWEKGGITNYVSLQNAGDWTLVSLGEKTNCVLEEFCSRIKQNGSPVIGTGTNLWLELDCDFASLLPVLGITLDLPERPPRLTLGLRGDGEYVKASGELAFPEPLHLEREPWMIPTNMIREPLVSFGAFQGLRPWLKTKGWLEALQLTNTPNQFFYWSINLSPVHVFAATPFPNASDEIDRVGPGLEKQINSWLTNNAIGSAEFSAPNHGISWVPVPLLAPTFQALPGLGGGLIFGRLAAFLPPPGQTAPPELLDHLTSRTNIVYYDWEITEMRLRQWLFLSQSLRVAFHRAQIPNESLSLAFLKVIATKLGNTVTEVSQSGPSTLTFSRKSHCGFTGLELHLLTDWVESPSFPIGLRSQLAGDRGAMRWNPKTQSLEPAGKVGPPK